MRRIVGYCMKVYMSVFHPASVSKRGVLGRLSLHVRSLQFDIAAES